MAKKTGKKRAKAGKKASSSARRPKKNVKKARARQATRAARKTPARRTAARKAATRKPAKRRVAPRAARKSQGNRGPARRKSPRPAARRKAPAAKAPARPAKAPAVAKARKPLPRNAATARANAEAAKKVPALNRERRRLAETDEELMPSAPSTLGYASGSSAARSGRSELRESLAQHTETGPALTGGDVDADWEDAYAVGDEAPGGDNPTPDQDRVDDIGKALGVQYEDNEELKGSEKIIERDRHRWELDPASSDDYRDRSRDEE